MTFEGKQFTTAAARLKGRAPEFEVEHWHSEPRPPDLPEDVEWEPDPVEMRVTLKVNPLTDIVRMGAAFGQFGKLMQAMKDGEQDSDEIVRQLDVQLPRVKRAVRDMLLPPSRLKWDLVEEGIDTTKLGEIVQWVSRELSGLDPTQQESSLNGSPPTGADSTDGALPAALTPPQSPSPAA